ncbi:LacI family DNA-binding transcriptional regulator [Devosia oryzisoli]|uniref:LacI family DNA-binding transcriptional regulator n=1 Tax=Devosia oryzisoli TaxID=2774138 RepID=UPI001AEE2E1E|nr:substrate-binding domain-containing protein [Devosia oryzisoli]
MTLKKLAEELGISVATVSRALAGHEQIAKKTRAKVAEAAQKLGYVPNAAARQLVSGRSGFVSFILPIRDTQLVDSYLGEFITGLGEGLVDHGVDLLLATAQQGQSELSVLKHVVESGRADGVVVPRLEIADQRVAYLLERRFPFVTHGRLLDGQADYSWLDADGELAFGEAFELLYRLGHRHFALLTVSELLTFRFRRERGLAQAVARRGDPDVRLDIVSAPRFDRQARSRAIGGMLNAEARPTAIIALFDELAISVMEEAEGLGLTVPTDLSVVGYDNIVAADYTRPGLTTFDAQVRSSAAKIAHMLMRQMSGEARAAQTDLIQPELKLRGSHGPAPGA